jgi:hypothetical protein
MTARVAIVAVLIVSLLALLFVWRTTSSENPGALIAAADADSIAPSARDASKPLETSTSDESAKPSGRQAAIGSMSTTVAAPAPAAAEPTSDATLVVQCRSKPSGKPLEGVRIIAATKDEHISSRYRYVKDSRGSLSDAPISGANGEVELALPSGLELEIRTKPNWTDTPAVRQDVSALARGERRTIVLEVPSGKDLEFHGVVVAVDGLKPIAGARVRVVISSSWQPRPGAGDPQNAHRDADILTRGDGRFEVSATSWKNPYLSVEADGYGVVLVELDKLHATEEHAFTIGLKAAGTIDATVVDGAGSPVAGAVVRASASGGELRQKTAVTESNDFASSARVPWSAETRMDGRCAIEGLAPDVQLTLTVLRDGKRLSTADEHVRLEPGEVRALRLEIGGACTIEGVLVAKGSTSVSGRSIWLEPADNRSAHYFRSESDISAKTETDAAGRFTFADVRIGKWWVGPAPSNEATRRSRNDEIVPLARLVDIPSGARRIDVEIEAHRGLYIRGRVLDAGGNGAVSRDVVAWSNVGYTSWTAAKEGGAFVLGPLDEGKYEVTAHGRDSELNSEFVTVSAGQENVVLRLRAGASIEGKVIDSATHQGCAASISLLQDHSVGASIRDESTQADGSFELPRVLPGTYDLLARVNDGRIAIQCGIEVPAGKKLKSVVLQTELGARLHLRYDGNGQKANVEIRTDRIWMDSIDLERGIASEVIVPKGQITIQLYVGGAKRVAPRELSLDAGEEKEIVFGDDR